MLAAEKKSLEENAFSGDLYDEALDKIDKLEGDIKSYLFLLCGYLIWTFCALFWKGEKNHWQHKSESLAKDVKRLLKQIEEIQSASSYQLKEASKALEKRNEEYKVSCHILRSGHVNKKNLTASRRVFSWK